MLQFFGRLVKRLVKVVLVTLLVLVVASIAVYAILHSAAPRNNYDDGNYVVIPEDAEASELSVDIYVPDSYQEYVERQESLAEQEMAYQEMAANVTEYTLVTATSGDIFVLEDDDGNLLSVRLSGIEILEGQEHDAKSFASMFLSNYVLRIEYSEEVFDDDGNLYVDLFLMRNVYYPERNFRDILLDKGIASLSSNG